jgi:ParB/RepB/Spo0J family partition protein
MMEPVIKRIPLNQIRPSKRNPRKIIRQDMIDARAASMKESGQLNPILIRPLIPDELNLEPDKNILYEIIDGELRYWAAKKNGDTDIEAKILDIGRVQAFIKAVTGNRAFNPGWFEDYLGMETMKLDDKHIQHQVIADTFEAANTEVTRAFRILRTLSEESRGLILQNLQKPKGTWQISENALYRLADLGDVDKVDKALPVVLDKRMTEPQTKAFVEHVQAGKPIEEFTPVKTAKAKRVKKSGVTEETAPTNSTVEVIKTQTDERAPTLPPVPPTLTDDKTNSRSPSLILETMAGISPFQAIRAKIKKGEKITREDWLLLLAHWTWEPMKWVFKKGIHPFVTWEHAAMKEAAGFIVPHPSSHSPGSHQSGHHSGSSGSSSLKPLQALAHWAVYVSGQLVLLDFVLSWLTCFYSPLKLRIEWPFRWLAHKVLVAGPAGVWAWGWERPHWPAAGAIGLFLLAGLFLALKANPRGTLTLAAVLILAWTFLGNWSNELSLPPIFSKPVVNVPAPIPTQPPAAVSSAPESKKAKVVAAKSQPESPKENNDTSTGAQGPNAFNGDSTDLALLQSAIAALPVNCVVKFFPVTPDSSMNPLMAVNRVGDLAVESEYSLRVGQGGRKITSVTPSATGLTIVTEGGLPLGGFFGGGSAIGFYWEDVLNIYCDELDTPSGKIYQFVLIATNLNQPLVVQCYTPNNLKHLVSALEYFIKSAQGKYVPVTGMPYLNQGMVLGDEGKITALWAGSPAEKAQAQIGDHLWAVNGSAHQTPSALEAQLQALPSGSQEMEVVTSKDWDREVEKENRLHSKQLRPNLLDLELDVPINKQ